MPAQRSPTPCASWQHRRTGRGYCPHCSVAGCGVEVILDVGGCRVTVIPDTGRVVVCRSHVSCKAHQCQDHPRSLQWGLCGVLCLASPSSWVERNGMMRARVPDERYLESSRALHPPYFSLLMTYGTRACRMGTFSSWIAVLVGIMVKPSPDYGGPMGPVF